MLTYIFILDYILFLYVGFLGIFDVGVNGVSINIKEFSVMSFFFVVELRVV